MKALIKKYHNEPKVDSVRIMRHIFAQKKEHSREVFLVPSISAACLFIAFTYFLVSLNVEFFGAAVSVYFALWGILFFLFNLIIGVTAFIVGHYGILLGFSCIAFLVEIKMFSRMNNDTKKEL